MAVQGLFSAPGRILIGQGALEAFLRCARGGEGRLFFVLDQDLAVPAVLQSFLQEEGAPRFLVDGLSRAGYAAARDIAACRGAMERAGAARVVSIGGRAARDTAVLAAAGLERPVLYSAVPVRDFGAAAGWDAFRLGSAGEPDGSLAREQAPAFVPRTLVVDTGWEQPDGQWGWTGLSALARAVEACRYRPHGLLAVGLARSAIGRIFEYLPLLAGNVQDRPESGLEAEAKEQVATASVEAGLAAGGLSGGYGRGGASLELQYRLQPGQGLVYAFAAGELQDGSVRPGGEKQALQAALGRLIGGTGGGMPDFVAAEVFRNAVQALYRRCGVPPFSQVPLRATDP